ncbi:MAG: FAD-dependent oxidoreductase [Pseudomonadota bacterium]
MQAEFIIIGAGMTGLSCARRLVDAGRSVVVLDKGRGIGGRLATRRTDFGGFDHGAQYVAPKTDGFANALAVMAADGAAATWTLDGRDVYVGTPGMNALAKHLGSGISIRQQALVTGLSETGGGWQVQLGDEGLSPACVVMTVPAPQAIDLLGVENPIADQISAVGMVPSLTLMAAFQTDDAPRFVTRRDPDDDLAWIALNSSKPGRIGEACWIAQASVAWSIAHLEHPKEVLAELMLPMLCQRIGLAPDAATYAAGHRWRYAMADRPFGQAFIKSQDGALYVGGDWCLGARVEDAWTSGVSIADDILANRTV